MSDAENGPSGLIFPSDDSEVSRVQQCLDDAGFSSDAQVWLIRILKRPDCFGDSGGVCVFRDDFADSLEHVLPGIVEDLRESSQTADGAQTRLVLLFSFLLGFGPVYSEVVRPNDGLAKSDGDWILPAWVGEFQRYAEFSAERMDWRTLVEIRNARVFLLFDLVPFLFPDGVPLDQVVNLDLLDPIRRRGWSSTDFEDPDQVEFWLKWRFAANTERRVIIKLNTLQDAFSDFPEDVLGDRILGLLHAIEYSMSIGFALASERLNPAGDGWRAVAYELVPFLDLLNEKQPESIPERPSLLKAWWRLSVVIHYRGMGALESGLSDGLKSLLVDSAARHIGMLRKVLRETPDEFKRKDSTGVPVADFYDKAFEVLVVFAAPWKCLRSLLLAFTEMGVPAVASDLRPWPEADREPPPQPFSQIPMWIAIAIYPQNLRDELKRDPHLQGLREAFAKFCLDRLKSRKIRRQQDVNVSHCADERFVEPRRTWRRCYVQAVAALHVNPGGRAHRTLFWLSRNDPDETVRTLAKRAHGQIRHLNRNRPNLDRGASPRRPLFEAYWWLRQAHLLTLGIEIDEAGAMRTRRTELHRTREKDDHLNSGRGRGNAPPRGGTGK